MGIGISTILVAAGAILIWAVDAHPSGFDLDVIGWIMLVVGASGAVLSVAYWTTWGGWRALRRDVPRKPR